MRVSILFSVLFLYTPVSAFENGHVAYKHVQVSEDMSEFLVTDGKVLIVAQTSKLLDDMSACQIVKDGEKLLDLIADPDINIEHIGQKLILQMIAKCQLYNSENRRDTSSGDGDYTFNHKIVQGKPFNGDFGTGSPSGAGSHFAIFPGTKWCGYENVAENMQDLGVHNETDACCRTHDHCPYYIDRFETKYHFFNEYPWTVSYCECDQHLFDCLKEVDNPTSNTVGNLFFGLLDVQCFTFKMGSYCENEGSILSHLWCSKKNKGYVADMQQFPHKWSDKDAESPDLVG